MRPVRGLILILAVLGLAGLWAAAAAAYPLDGFEQTGIARLEAFRLAQAGKMPGRRQPPGALLTTEQVDLRMTGAPDFRIPPPDADFTREVRRLLVHDPQRYGIAVLDLSDPARPRYAEVRGGYRANPGSVGKVLIATGLFQALADLYPDSVEKRRQLLRNTLVTADGLIVSDHHKVPLWRPGEPRVTYRPLAVGDRANLYTYLDWMLSASSNAAASMVLRELMLLVHFGRRYPVGPKEAAEVFERMPPARRAELLARALQAPVTRNGLSLENLRQGSFFTRRGKQLVPGTTSHATPAELMRWMLKLEQGRIVDAFSSREIKRLLYMTQRRIRYASSPALGRAAVYFKSGSLYRCRPEPGFTCKKYHGNVVNMLNSVAIVEHPADGRRLHYMVAVMSNVLRENSAVVHQSLASGLHRLIEQHHRRP